jgi:hypothetical protein
LDENIIFNSKGKKQFLLLKKNAIFHNCLFEAKDKCCENGGSYDEDVKSHYDYIKDEFEINKG